MDEIEVKIKATDLTSLVCDRYALKQAREKIKELEDMINQLNKLIAQQREELKSIKRIAEV